MKTRPIQLLDVVASLKSIENEGVILGQVGTVVEKLAPGVFDVEFALQSGETIAILTMEEKDLILLHFEKA